MIRVAVIDDQEIVRDRLVTLVDLMTEIAAVGTADNEDEAVKVVALERPDVVLMDLRMPGQDGVEAMARIRSKLPRHTRPRVHDLQRRVDLSHYPGFTSAARCRAMPEPLPESAAAARIRRA